MAFRFGQDLQHKQAVAGLHGRCEGFFAGQRNSVANLEYVSRLNSCQVRRRTGSDFLNTQAFARQQHAFYPKVPTSVLDDLAISGSVIADDVVPTAVVIIDRLAVLEFHAVVEPPVAVIRLVRVPRLVMVVITEPQIEIVDLVSVLVMVVVLLDTRVVNRSQRLHLGGKERLDRTWLDDAWLDHAWFDDAWLYRAWFYRAWFDSSGLESASVDCAGAHVTFVDPAEINCTRLDLGRDRPLVDRTSVVGWALVFFDGTIIARLL